MPYNKFRIKDLEDKLGLNVMQKAWLPADLPTEKADSLLATILQHAEQEALNTEKARSEFIIAPVLQAFRRKNIDRLSIYSGYEFNVDKSLDLLGFCDFILSLSVHKLTVEAPVFMLVETKKLDIDDRALAQCGAEMFAARIFNQKANRPQKIIYGCVTSAFNWCFLRLEDQTLSIDPNYVPLTFKSPHGVMSVLQYIFDCPSNDSV